MFISSLILLIKFDKKIKVDSPFGPLYYIIQENHKIISIFLLILASLLFAVNYMIPQSPSFDHESQIILGNSSKNISIENIERLQTIAKDFIIAKRSQQSTPSRWDIDNNDLSDNEQYWKTHSVQPFFDCHISSNITWTVIHIELYYPNNGIGPIGTKHTHDYEFIEFYFFQNETTPRFVAFPTYTELLHHPRELVAWSEMPKLQDKKCLVLDPQTNAFAERYDKFPNPSKNLYLTSSAPQLSDSYEYLSDFEKIQFWSSICTAIFLFLYMFTTHRFSHVLIILLLFSILSAIYPYLSLQYDFVGDFSFRVWQDGEHYEDSFWYVDHESREYANTYRLPHDRDRWTQPAYELGAI